jgi:RNA polymerase sigma factor (sigma-70 family)
MATQQTAPILRHLRGLVLAEAIRRLTDRELLRLFVEACDETAFAALVQRHGRLVLSVCRHVLRHEQDAEDAFQAVFLVLARKASSIHKADSVASWLYGVAHRTAMKAKTTAARRRASEKQAEERAAEQPAAAASLRELQALLDEEVLRLPEKYRAPFVLCCLEGKSREEAARELGWKEGTVSSRVAHAREQLRQRLARRGVTLSAALCAGAIAEGASAAVPAALAEATVGRAVLFTTGSAAGVVSEPVITLAGGVLKAMVLSHFKAGLILALVLGTVGVGAGLSMFPSPAETKQEAPEKQIAQQPPREVKQPVRTDSHGDPLPEGAIARIGTVRLRHDGLVTSLAFAPDGKTLVSAGLERTLGIWDVASGKLLRRLVGHNDFVRAVAVSPDGKTIASASLDKTVRLWDFATGKELSQLPEVPDPVLLLAFAADGKTLVSVSGTGTIRRWRTADGKDDGQWQVGDRLILLATACSPDGKILALSDRNNKIHLWDTVAGKEERVLEDLAAPVAGLAFSPDGRRLVSNEGRGSFQFWRVDTGKKEDQWQTNTTVIFRGQTLAFSPDGKYLAGAESGRQVNNRNSLHLWDVATGEEVRVLRGHGGDVWFLCFSPDGKTLASCGADGTIRLWDVETGRDLHPSDGHGGMVTSLAFLPDGKSLVSSSGDRTIRVWDAHTGKEQRRMEVPRKEVPATFPWTPFMTTDGRGLLAGNDDKKICFWDASTGKECRDPLVLEKQVLSLALSPDGKTLLTGEFGNQVRTWDVPSGKELSSLAVQGSVSDVAFSPQGKKLVVYSERNVTWFLRELDTGKELARLVAKDERGKYLNVNYLQHAFSPDGRTVAVSFAGKTIHLFETATGQERKEFAQHPDYTGAVAFAPDGRTLASGCWDGTIRFWDVASGKEQAARSGAQRLVLRLAYAPNGKTLASGGGDTTILIWDVPTRARQPAASVLADKELEDLWADLAASDARQAGRAIDKLTASPKQAAAFLQGRLRPVEAADAKVVARLIADLDSTSFAVRDQARKELEKLGDRAESALRRALEDKPVLETAKRLRTLLDRLADPFSSPESLRQYRALEVLESLDTASSRPVLEALAKGADSWQTREAKASLRRLLQRTAAHE